MVQNQPQGTLASKVQEIGSWTLVDWLSVIFPFVSAFATFHGANKLIGNGLYAFGVALVAFFFIAAFYRSYLKWYPTANTKAQQKLMLPMLVFAIFAICLTTPFSVATFGGDVALRKDFERTIATAEARTNNRIGDLNRELALAASLGSYGRQFTDLASAETAGAFTGTSGRGDAAVTFETVGRSLEGMRQQVEDNRPVVGELKEQSKAIIRDLRSISYMRVSQQEKVSRFAARLNDLNDLFAQMDAASVLPAVAQSAGSLDMVANMRTGEAGTQLGQRQSEAITRAQALVARAQRDIRVATAEMRAQNEELAPLAVIDESEAIFKYWRTIIWAWAAALALDFAPLLFLFMLSQFHGIERTQRKSTRKPREGDDVVTPLHRRR